MDKKELRKEYRKIRDSLPEEKIAASAYEIVSNLIAGLDFDDYDTCFFYYPLKGEISLLPLAEQVLSIGKRVAFPRVHGETMDFYLVNHLKRDFKEGTFHVMEPIGNTLADAGNKTVCFTPGLVYDSRFYRMGYGKGYYDNYFKEHPEIFRVGICMNRFFIPKMPTYPTDVKMQWIVTENHIYKEPS